MEIARVWRSSAAATRWQSLAGALGSGSDALTMLRTREMSTTTSLQRSGQGGRNSNSGHRITIFGATGFVGRYVVNALGRGGSSMVVTTRGDDMSWRHLKPLADYGKIVPSYIHLKDEDSVRTAIQGSDTVINLMGKHYETTHYLPMIMNCSFEDVHVHGASLVARLAREEDVKHFVHVSSVAAKDSSSSRWAKTKAEGERMIEKEFPGACIIRCNNIYGEEDRFLNFHAVLGKNLPMFPLVKQGAAKSCPIYVGDVANAIAVCATNWETAGKVYELNGEHEYSYKEVIEYVLNQIHQYNTLVDVPQSFAENLARLVDLFPNPIITQDMVRLLSEDQLPNPGMLGFKDLGITPAQFETKAFNFLYKYRSGGHFAKEHS